ncbi:MAG: YkgJ family cysteine cluster protein [Kofleriaceae bacterium]
MTFDCRTCGACCINPPSNREVEFPWWVELEAGDAVLATAALVVRDPDGVPHLRLAPDGRCVALAGGLAEHVACTIYEARPAACRRVEPGDELCRLYRADHGLTS